jgi:hypothetical protein
MLQEKKAHSKRRNHPLLTPEILKSTVLPLGRLLSFSASSDAALPFAITQIVFLLIFAALTALAVKRFRSEPMTTTKANATAV